MFKKLAAVINEIETLLGVIESAFFHTRDCWILERGSKQFFLHVSKREGEMMIYRRSSVVWSGTAVSTVFYHAVISSQKPHNLLL